MIDTTALSLYTESARILAIPFTCWTLTCLGMAAASKPHILHLSLSVFPVKIFCNGLWSGYTSRSGFCFG